MNDAWLAGFIDGDGSIQVQVRPRRPTPNHHVRITVTQKDRRLTDYLHDHFGGSLYQHKTLGWWQWSLGGRAGLVVLRQIEPFLVLKQQQARLAIELAERLAANFGGTRVTDEEREYRADLVRQIRALNGRTRGVTV